MVPDTIVNIYRYLAMATIHYLYGVVIQADILQAFETNLGYGDILEIRSPTSFHTSSYNRQIVSFMFLRGYITNSRAVPGVNICYVRNLDAMLLRLRFTRSY